MPEPDFTDQEKAELRAVLANDRHLKWFWATSRKWAGGIAAVLATAVAFREDLRSLVLWFMGKS